MIRLFGGLLIFIVSSYCGFYFSDRLKKHRDFLRSVSGALTFTASEIEFGHCELERIFRRLDTSPAMYGFFNACADKIGDCGIRRAWADTVDEYIDRTGITEPEKDVLLQLGNQLGMSDADGQKKAISRTVKQLDEYAGLADAEYTRLSKPYRSCGILLGVFVLIIIA